jgi:hypothetical protein
MTFRRAQIYLTIAAGLGLAVAAVCYGIYEGILWVVE